MLAFLATYAAVYAGIHLMVYLWLRPILPRVRRRPLWAALWSLAMIAAPVGARLLERYDGAAAAGCLAWAGYLWMGFILLAAMATVDFLALELLWRLAARAISALPRPNHRVMVAVSLAAALAVGVYGFFEARSPVVEHVTITTTKLPAGVGRVRVVLLSDLHLGWMADRHRVERVVELATQAKPDLLLLSGDMVDGYIPHRDRTARLLREIPAPLGRFAVTGNHEAYAGVEFSRRFLEEAGFRLLQQEAVIPGGIINVVGVDDPGRWGVLPDELGALHKARPGLFTILLKHQPRVGRKSQGLFDLQLSGHTHGGQIFPFRYVVSNIFPYFKGLYALPGGGHVYTTRGSGTWGPPLRVLARPEVTVVDIVPAKGENQTSPTKIPAS